MGFTRIVLRRLGGQIPDLQKENLQKVLISAEHLLSLINTLLDLAKIDARQNGSGRRDFPRRGRHQHDDGYGRAAAQRRARADRQRHPCRICRRSKPTVTSSNRFLFNLLSNAAKFTEQGEIKVSAARDNGNLEARRSPTAASA